MAKTKNKFSYFITLIILVFAAAAIVTLVLMPKGPQTAPPQNIEPSTQDGILMDTYMKQTTYDTSEDVGDKLRQMFEYLSAFEAKTSAYRQNSEISKINDYSGVMAIEVSDEVYRMLARSKELCLQSNGRFDITVGPLVKLWNINGDSPGVPEESQINIMKKRVNIKKLTLDSKKKTAKLDNPYMSLDLGGVAKGFACDLAREKYKEIGLSSCLLSLGGNIYSFGTKPDGTAFIIGLRDPLGEAEDIFGTVTAPDQVISTTGGYERYFEENGIRYHHVLDPKTGYPAKTDLLSVTVIAKEGILADYLSTNLFIGGKAEVLKNLNQENFDIVAIDTDKKIYLSEGIKRNFRLAEDSAYQLANMEN